MATIITGANGFIGQELAVALASDTSVGKVVLTDLKRPSLPDGLALSGKLSSVAADLTHAAFREEILSQDIDCVYLLHGIMSGAAEANLELGLAVNLHATFAILDYLRIHKPGVKVVYASVGAAYGPPSSPEEVISENTAPNPQSSYGTQKVIIESIINDFSRRGLIDGRICRLPTVMPRSGAPTGAASSFASDIIREPLNGRKAALPVSDKTLKIFACSPSTVIKNLIHAKSIPRSSFAPYRNRVVNLPGVAVTVQEILDAVEEVSPKGKKVLELIEEKRDEATEKIVASWPSNFNFSRAFALGFVEDPGLKYSVRQYYSKFIAK